MKKNKFIAFEGLDACGKTTLSQKFIAEHKDFYLHSSIVENAKPLLKNINEYESIECALLYFLLNNMLKSRDISSDLQSTNTTIDRYIFSTLAYQSIMLGEEKVKILFDQLDISNIITLPDLIVFIRADKETIQKRIHNRTGKIQWYGDKVSQKHDVESQYKKVFNWFNIPIIEVDTSDSYNRSIEENYKIMNDKIKTHINL